MPRRTDGTPRRKRRPLTADRQALAASNIRLAQGLARPLKELFPSRGDDLEAAALLALVEAAESFDPARGVKFSTFATRRIQGGLRDYLRAERLKGFRGPGQTEESPTFESPEEPAEEVGRVLFGTPDEPAETAVARAEWLERATARLSRRQLAVFDAIYRDGLTVGQTRRVTGETESAVNRLHRAAIRRMFGSNPPPWTFT